MLKLHHYLGPDVNTAVIDAVLEALMVNDNCQALYIQNFNEGFRDEQVRSCGPRNGCWRTETQACLLICVLRVLEEIENATCWINIINILEVVVFPFFRLMYSGHQPTPSCTCSVLCFG